MDAAQEPMGPGDSGKDMEPGDSGTDVEPDDLGTDMDMTNDQKIPKPGRQEAHVLKM